MKHLHIWECPAEARPYRPNEKKLDSKTISCYSIGYSERSRGYKFYDPITKLIFETVDARYFEDVEFEGGERVKDFVFEEEYVHIPPIAFDNDQEQTIIPDIVQDANSDLDNIIEPPVQVQEIIPQQQTPQPQEPAPLRRSTRERRGTISDDYVVYL